MCNINNPSVLRSFTLIFLLVVGNVESNFNLTIIHTNDVHARIEQTNKYGGSCSDEQVLSGDCYGGVARRHTKVQEIRENNENVLFLDGGDQFQGTLWYSVYQGAAAAHFTSLLGYDAAAIGNHEFDDGPEVLARYLRNVTFPVVCCNLNSSNEPLLNALYSPSVVLQVGGERIGIVGYLTPETKFIVPAEHVENVNFMDEIPCLQSEVNRLKNEGINKIVALGHSGFPRDIQIAQAVEGIDVIIGGHSNTFLYTGEPPSNEEPIGEYPYVVTQSSGRKVYIVQGYAFGKYLGYLDVTFDDEGEVTQASGNPILLDNSVPQDPAILSDVEKWSERLQVLKETDVANTFVHLEGDRSVCRVKECNLGNMITDAVFASQLLQQPKEGENWATAAAALWNGGGIRASLPQGSINLGMLMEVLPFRNEVVGCRLKGVYIKQMLEHSVSKVEEIEGRFLQMSGMKVVFNMYKPKNHQVESVQIRCSDCTIPVYEDLDESKMYSIVTSGFLLGGGDGYDMLRDYAVDVLPYGFTAVEAAREYMEQHQPIIQGEEGRISYMTSWESPPLPDHAPSIRHNTLALIIPICTFLFQVRGRNIIFFLR